MTRIHTIKKVAIFVYPGDHAPPHFHIRGVDDEAMVEIATLAVLRGVVPGRDALAWATDNVETIRAAWNRLNPRLPV